MRTTPEIFAVPFLVKQAGMGEWSPTGRPCAGASIGLAMKVSIVTPALNGARFLPAAIASIGAQSFEDWEHIIVDGGSTDGTGEIARAWAARESRARFVSLPGQGMYAAIFEGFARAAGDILCWLNCDDLYAPWALSTVVSFMRRRGSVWATGMAGAWDAEGRLRSVRPAGIYPTSFIRRGWRHEGFLGAVQQESTFFARSLLNDLSTEEKNEVAGMRLAGDFMLWRRFARRARLDHIPTALGGFRVHGENLSSVRREDYLDEVRAAGGRFPPAIVARPADLIGRLWSALALQRLIEAEDRALAAETAPGAHGCALSENAVISTDDRNRTGPGE